MFWFGVIFVPVMAAMLWTAFASSRVDSTDIDAQEFLTRRAFAVNMAGYVVLLVACWVLLPEERAKVSEARGQVSLEGLRR